ncbi:hypothetical protein [Actinorugispora endophytica]|uniref:DNA recombination-mediator protein A n=1 Tax=Actinorugispora endophytica TaxID=1605990 RepID=A0A4R6UG55_9ACTN|nr:hypothetical protein [Actinorugispora endophytica]TDQ45758.1 hypothetical protein EV190_12941 [Actinorugispora endophytica]
MSARRVAITGHRGLPPGTTRLVESGLRGYLAALGPGLVGLSCLADGADTLFAHAVLALGGALEVVVPSSLYREALPPEHHGVYDALLSRASAVRRLPFTDSTPEAHLAAGRLLVDECDELVAVWDGAPALGPGGTADVVGHAREHACPVHVVWPPGARRW